MDRVEKIKKAARLFLRAQELMKELEITFSDWVPEHSSIEVEDKNGRTWIEL